MLPRFLLDTHVLVRWLGDARKLTREQSRLLDLAARRNEAVAISSTTLLEVALLTGAGKLRVRLDDVIEALRSPSFHILPLTFEIAAEVAAIGDWLKDPIDRAIVATARVHRLRLMTSDQRIIASRLVAAVD